MIPEQDIRTDEDLLDLLEKLRKMGIAGHDQLDELAGLIKMKIERYGRRKGLSPWQSKMYGRTVSLPILRMADAMLLLAGYAKTCRNRFEAFAVAIDDNNASASDFEIKNKPRKRAA